MRRLLLSVGLCAMLVLPAGAAAWPEIDTRALEDYASAATDLPLSPELTLEAGLASLGRRGAEQVRGIVRERLRAGGVILTAALLSALLEPICRETGNGTLARLAGAVTLAGASLGEIGSMAELGRRTVEQLTDFDRLLIPAITTAAAASGSVTGAAARQMATLFAANLLLTLMRGGLIPMVYLYAAACTASAASGREGLDRLAGFFRWVVQETLKWLLILFTAYLSVSGVISGTADKAAAKLTRFAISGMVPVVGGILSDASESLLAGAGLMRSAIGVFGTVAVLGFCLTPFLRLGVQYLICKGAAVLAGVIGGGVVAELAEKLSAAYGLFLAMTGTAALLTLLSLMLTAAVAVG